MKKKRPQFYGPTSRDYGRIFFDSFRQAVLWCKAHPAAWKRIENTGTRIRIITILKKLTPR